MNIRTLASVFLAGWLAVPLAFAADAGCACKAPKPAEKTSAIDVPQSTSDDAELLPSPEEEARERAFADYLRAVKNNLWASSDPADWVTSLMLGVGHKDPK